jgi:copper transport protein
MGRRLRRIAIAVLLGASAVVASSGVAAAHALLASSDPAANAVLATAPTSVSITFTEPADPALSTIQVFDASGSPHTSGPVVSSAPDVLTVPLGPLSDGVYTVTWRTVSAADGHAADGSFAFSVGSAAAPPSAPAASASGASAVSARSVAARAFMFVGFIGLLGTLLTAEMLGGGRRRRIAWLRTAAWWIAVIGSVAVFITQAADAGVKLGQALGTSLGADALTRLLPLLLAGFALIGGSRATTRRKAWMAAATALVLLSILADAAVSHASTGSLPQLNVALQWLHVVAIGLWLGGLAGLLAEMRDPDLPDRTRLMRGFSRWATAGILLVAVSGVARAAFELHSPDELVTTDYGRLILVKSALFVVLAVLGAVNHFRTVPGGDRRLPALRRIGSTELMVGTTMVVVAAALVSTAPPTEADVASGPAALTADGADYATTVRAHLAVTQDPTGQDAFRLTVTDYDTGAAAPVSSVRLRFALPARPDVAPSTLDLQPGGDGSFTGTGANLSLGGNWDVTAIVGEPSTSVEVPLQVAVATPPNRVDVNRAANGPTIYTIHLPGDNEAQVYLDEWAAGAADLHITFFDPDGKELPASHIAATSSTGGAAPAPVTMSPIEPGHSSGHLLTTAHVPIEVTVTATAPGGEPLTFSVTVTPNR